MIPGGGVGIFDGCVLQWGVPKPLWGARYGGISEQKQCKDLAPELSKGCNWRWDWYKNADNPHFDMVQVQCPESIIGLSGCERADNKQWGGPSKSPKFDYQAIRDFYGSGEAGK